MDNQTENQEQQPSTEKVIVPEKQGTNIDEVKSFYKDSFPKIFRAIFTEPIKGTYELFSSRSEKSYHNSLFLILTTGLLFTFLPYIAVGDARNFVGFKYFLMMGITAVLCLLVISILSFIIKSVSGKAEFKNELLTGGLCGIPLSLLIVIGFLMSLFSNKIVEGLMNPQALLDSGVLIVVIIFYVLLSMINIFQQSLKSSGTNDALAWYLSPIAIMVSFYVTAKLVFELSR